MMTHPWWSYALAFMAGMGAGAINLLAGGGSTLTLPALILLGLPADVANGTKRVGVLLQNIVGIVTLRRGGKLPLDAGVWKLAVPSLIGGIAGALLAADLGEEWMNLAVGAAMVFVLVLLFYGPSWSVERTPRMPWWMVIAMFVVGFYGGFVQAGVGVLLIAALVGGCHYNPVEANGIKLILTLGFTMAALPIFAANDQVDWGMGGLVAVGQGIGAFIAARYMTKSENATRVIRAVLVVVIVATLVKLAAPYLDLG